MFEAGELEIPEIKEWCVRVLRRDTNVRATIVADPVLMLASSNGGLVSDGRTSSTSGASRSRQKDNKRQCLSKLASDL